MDSATLDQASKVLDLLKGIPKEKLQKIFGLGVLADLRDGDITKFNRDEFRRMVNLGSLSAPPFYGLLVNYSRSISKGIKAGHYDYANSDITDKNFPTTQQGAQEVSVQPIHFNKTMSTDQVLAELDKMSLRPANLQELLALGEKCPDLQREFPIIALGSVWQDRHGIRSCPCLHRDGSERDIYLYWFGDDWSEICRFAAVSK
ncbi:MAG: hypothetical protein AAB824_00645 [Patescibacteria group bacterium]